MPHHSRLLDRLRESALAALRRHGLDLDELQVQERRPEAPDDWELRGHRIRIRLTDRSASFQARGGKWSGERQDFPSDGALAAAFEERLHKALSGESRG